MKKYLMLMVLISDIALAQYPAKYVEIAKKIGVDNSARCYLHSFWVLGVAGGNSKLIDQSKEYGTYFSEFGDILVGKERFAAVVNNSLPKIKALPENQKIALWQKCQTLLAEALR